jgi:signal transduction histidine kinase
MPPGAEHQRWLPDLRLRAKLTIGIVLPLVLILGAFTLIEYNRHQSVVLSNLSLLASHSAQVIENNLRHQMLKSDFEELQALLDSIGTTEEFNVVYLLDTTGEVIFAPNGVGVGTHMENDQPDCLACHRLSPDERPGSVVVTTSDGQRVFRSMNPIVNSPDCAQCHNPEERLIGLLLTDISMAPIEAPLAAHLKESFLWWGVTILVVVVVVNLALSRLVLGRLERLSKAIAGFGEGHLPVSLPESSRDEIGQLTSAFNSMAQQVDARSKEVQLLSDNLQRQHRQRGELLQRLITAQEDERKRVARELHDQLGQALGGLAFKIKATRSLIKADTDRAYQELDHTGMLIQDATDQMYDLILALRPSVLDDLGLTSALRAHAERLLDGTGIAFSLESSGSNQRLPTEVETALYRIFQEALHNVVRHSDANCVSLELDYQEGIFRGIIRDNGQGFDLESGQCNGDGRRGLGLLGIQERIGLIGGQIEIRSQLGQGVEICIEIPLQEIEVDKTHSDLDC